MTTTTLGDKMRVLAETGHPRAEELREKGRGFRQRRRRLLRGAADRRTQTLPRRFRLCAPFVVRLHWGTVGMTEFDDLVSESTLQFEGPPTAHCLGQRYVVLSGEGVLPEGAKVRGYPTREEATEALRQAFAAYTQSAYEDLSWHATQIAWRRKPQIEETKGVFYPTCRLAVWRTKARV